MHGSDALHSYFSLLLAKKYIMGITYGTALQEIVFPRSKNMCLQMTGLGLV